MIIISTYSNRALRDPWDPVLPDSLKLPNPMPMNRSAITVVEVIDHRDLEHVSPIPSDQRPWVRAIDEGRWSAVSVTAESLAAG